MLEQSINRRLLLKGTAGLVVLAAMPELATAAPALGNPRGDVTIAEFVDYQCPVCKLAFVQLRKLMAEDKGVRLVMKDWPIFGDASRDAARMALSAGPRYAQAVDALMANQQGLSPHRTDAILESVGVNAASLRAGMASRQAKLDSQLAGTNAQASAFGLRGTPALVIGGTVYRHGMTVAELRQAVAKARAA
ncbi:DsbA family protein [Mesorhizobium sp.]|uniref:DsbA family protein n=1 Tax=Mesorhizobium sp. TaxID=1871066 RepID=UPI0025F814B0|nr:DsbA family protein [Mesorhizobium sp.]